MTGAEAHVEPGRRQQVVEHRHAHDETGAHLGGHERRTGVGDARVDLDAAIHRPGVHHDLPGANSVRRDAVERGVLAERGDEAPACMRSDCMRRT